MVGRTKAKTGTGLYAYDSTDIVELSTDTSAQRNIMADEPATPDHIFLTRGKVSSLSQAALLANDGNGANSTIVELTNLRHATGGIVDGRIAVTALAKSGSFDYISVDANGERVTGHVTFQATEVTGGNGTIFRLDASFDAGDIQFVAESGTLYDQLYGGAGNDRIVGGTARDYLYGRSGADLLIGGADDDFYYVDEEDTIVEVSGGGHDTIFSRGDFTLAVGVDVETLIFRGPSAVTGVGNELSNLIVSRGSGDRLYGMAGDDTFKIAREAPGFVDGGDGIDTILANPFAGTFSLASPNVVGVENLTGSNRGDRLYGNDGDNVISGGDGRNSLFGGGGDDTLYGYNHRDRLTGGTGDDTYYISRATTITENVGEGFDTIIARHSIHGLTGNVEVLRLIENANDSILGTDGAEQLYGNMGKNSLSGRGGDDYLNGNQGADRLIGGTGDDEMRGGLGADAFVFNSVSELGTGVLDRITDFSSAELDKIDLSNIRTRADDGAFTFIGKAAFTTTPHDTAEVRFETMTGGNLLVQGDSNHDGVADFAFIVQAKTLAAADFIL